MCTVRVETENATAIFHEHNERRKNTTTKTCGLTCVFNKPQSVLTGWTKQQL